MNPLPHIITFILLMVSLLSPAQQKTDMLLHAEASLIQGDTVAAIDHFRNVLTVYPQSFAASIRLAEVYYAQQDYQKAVQYCNIALDINDNFLNQTLEKLERSNNPTGEERKNETENVTRYNSDRADVLHLKGLIRVRQFRPKDAIEVFKSALEIKIDSKRLTDLALAYLETGLLHDAFRLLHDAKTLDSADYTPYFNLANAHYEVQHLDSALYYYQITQGKAPDLKWPYLYVGLIYTEYEQYEEAIKQFSHFIALDSTHEEAYFRRAVVRSQLRHWEDAMKDWGHVLQINPENIDAWRNKGLSHFQSAQYDSAIEAFNKALEFQPDGAYTYINRGYSHYLVNNPKQALADLNKGLDSLPKYYLGYYFRALVYLQLKEKKKACRDVQTAITLGMKEKEIDKKLLKKCF